MRHVREWIHRLFGTVRPPRQDEDLQEELRAHVALAEDRGRRATGASQAMDALRDQRGLPWLGDLGRDAHHAARMLRRYPGFAAVVILTLAVGIGLNTAVFSLFNAVLLRPLPYPHADRLVTLSLHGDTPFGAIPISEFAHWREQATAFELMAAYEHTQDHTLQTADRGTQVRNAWVTDDFWALAGARPMIGRLPMPGEAAVLLSGKFFEAWFGGDASVVGTPVRLNGRPILIAGVLPQDFRFEFPREALGPTLDPKAVDVYRPYGPGEAQPRAQGVPVRVVARLRSGRTIEDAHADLAAIRARLALTSPASRLDRSTLSVAPLHDSLVQESRRALWIVLSAVTFVLLIACANVGNLLLVRASARRRELAVRVSMGAGRSRLVRQLLTEGLVLALLGGTSGIVLAHGGLNIILALLPAETMPRLSNASIDVRALFFAVGLSIVTAVLFELAPARALWKRQPLDALRDATQNLSATGESLRGRHVLVAAELALATVLLAGAGLMVRSFWSMYSFPAGFDPARSLTMRVMFTADYRDSARRLDYVEEFIRQVESIPDVEAAGISAVGGASPVVQIAVDGKSARVDGSTTHLYAASAGYGRAMGFRLLSGRWFTDREPGPVAVITESVARREFGAEDPVGRRINLRRVSAPPGAPAVAAMVVGVVEDLRYSRLDAPADPQVFIPYRHYPGGVPRFTTVVRTTDDPRRSASEVQRRVTAVDRTLPIFDVMTLEQALADSIAPRRFNLLLLGAFSAVALLLALIGIYGVMAYAVKQRVREIGIRLALGATRKGVAGMVIRQGMTVAAVGVTAGLLTALALTELMQGLLYGVRPTDPLTFAAATALLGAAALVACGVPALKAALVEPATALRAE